MIIVLKTDLTEEKLNRIAERIESEGFYTRSISQYGKLLLSVDGPNTEKLVKENNMTTLMVTHNLSDALRYGNRLIMFDRGHIIHDFNAEEKAKLKPTDLYQMFSSYEID